MHSISPLICALGLTWSGAASGASGQGALLALQRGTTRIKAALVRRDQSEARAREQPGFRCPAVASASAEVDEAWADLAEAWRAAPVEPPALASALATIQAERALDAEHAAAFAAWCEGLPAVGPPPAVPPATLVDVGAGLQIYGELLVARVPPGWPADADAGRALAERLARIIADDWAFVLVLVEAGVDPARAERASLVIERGIPGLGDPAPWRPAHLPEWEALHSLTVLDGPTGLQQGASLRALVATFGNRLAAPGCPPALGGGWGISDVGGQLGGGAPGSLVALGDGRWRIAPLFGARPRRAANGGNAVPYAPIELYLLGLIDAEDLPVARQLADAVEDGDAYRAAGVCRLDGPTLLARFGRRPRRVEPYSVGVVIATERPLDPARAARHRRAAAAFFAPGPDDDPFTYNYHEATGGRGRLLLVPPRLRGRASGRTVP